MSAVAEQPSVNAGVAGRSGPLRNERLRAAFSRASLIAALVLLGATFVLLSPPRGKTYPGALLWGQFSILRPLTELLSLNGLVSTARGTEIKDFAFHLAVVVGLLLLAGRLCCVRSLPRARLLVQPWVSAQLLLAGWVLLSALSGLWSGDAALAWRQAALYGLALAWAVALAWTLDSRDVPRLLAGLVVVSAVAGVLCVWYYFERNPHHRPGFPLGNPGTLAASLLPAILVALSVLAGAVQRWWQTRQRPRPLLIIGATAALLPLLWCFALANSRSSLLALAAGLLTIVVLKSGRRVRWVLAGTVLIGVVALGIGLANYSRLDTAMARGATIRFRLYAWRYAAALWNQSWLTSIAGQGAGAYPRLAGQLSIHDRTLDPAAFMGEIVEHAHNELFEVLTEIGLVGGVTFVGGFLATLIAGGALLRGGARHDRQWLHVALLAALVALLTDALFGPGLRLAGVPAVFYTLVGVLWAACRCASRPQVADAIAALAGTPAGLLRSLALRRIIAGVLAGVLAVGAGWLTLRNWAGVLREESANVALAGGDIESAKRGFEFAEAHLLDPVRQLISQRLALQAKLGAAREAYAAFHAQRGSRAAPGSQPATAAVEGELAQLWRTALERCQVTCRAASRLHRRAPTLMHTAAVGARAAELLARLYEATDSPKARRWWLRAGLAWRQQRLWRPYDAETLLALSDRHYPARLADRLGLLRDALRSTAGRNRSGEPLRLSHYWQDWQTALRRLASQDGVAETIALFLAVIGPVDPETDVDSLIASRAPEAYRLAAHWEALRGNYAKSREYAAKAARLYKPMRHRFPELESVALLEQAEFTLRQSPGQSPAAVNLLREAIRRLPKIQQQKHEALALPFRSWLAVALLASGAEAEAADVLRSAVGKEALLPPALAESYVKLAALYVRQPPERRPPVEPWLTMALQHQPAHLHAWGWLAWLAAERGDLQAVRAILTDAATSGVSPEDVQRMRHSLSLEFPALRERIQQEQGLNS